MFYKRIIQLFFRIFFNNEALTLPHSRRGRLKTSVIIAVPIIVQNLVQHFQMVIDRFFLGNLNPVYLSVLGNVFVPYGSLELFLVATGTGLSVLAAQALGSGRPEHARMLGESSFVFSTLLSSSIFVFWQTSSGLVFSLLGTDASLVSDARAYIRILSFSLLFSGLDMTSVSILSATGLTAPIMLTGMMKSVLNIFLTWVLVFGNLGLPALGVEGAAVATVIANAAGSLTLFFITLTNSKLPFRFQLSSILRPSWAMFRRILKVGLPSGMESLLWFVGQLTLLKFINDINPLAPGIYTLTHNVYNLAVFVYLGFARATITLVGQYWGAGRIREARLAGLEGQALSLGVSVAWGAVIFSFAVPILSIFTEDTYITLQGAQLMRIASAFVIFQSFNVVMGHAIRGTGDTNWMLFTQIFGTIFVVGLSWLMIFQWQWGLLGVMVIMTLDEFLRGGVNTARFLWIKGESS